MLLSTTHGKRASQLLLYRMLGVKVMHPDGKMTGNWKTERSKVKQTLRVTGRLLQRPTLTSKAGGWWG